LSGTPVLGVKGGISDELVEDGITGRNVSSLDEALLAIPDLFKLDTLEVRERGVEKFSINNVADRFIEIYNKIIGGKNE
jgi:glycosyltransferase involved in cell wall biosynthesis